MDLDRKRKRIGGLKGLVQREGSLLIFRGGRRRILLGSHAHSGVLSDGQKGGRRGGVGAGFIKAGAGAVRAGILKSHRC